MDCTSPVRERNTIFFTIQHSPIIWRNIYSNTRLWKSTHENLCVNVHKHTNPSIRFNKKNTKLPNPTFTCLERKNPSFISSKPFEIHPTHDYICTAKQHPNIIKLTSPTKPNQLQITWNLTNPLLRNHISSQSSSLTASFLSSTTNSLPFFFFFIWDYNTIVDYTRAYLR